MNSSFFDYINNNELSDWGVVNIGIRNCWIDASQVKEYAVQRIGEGDELSRELSSLAYDDNANRVDLESLTKKMAGIFDEERAFNLWKLAKLVRIEEGVFSEDSKVRILQEVYAELGYPEDMKDCSIYSGMGISPLACMRKIIEELKVKFDIK
ncbi:DUF2247 family protein [Xanthomonas oryzae]|uniref:DUF2247 family protein n=1 Tax=Xanthomonas oryzae TaxID=347 RepID=UPI002DF6EB06|nr:DUF2247 family protein [Xanthomonas oryzae pv. oryzicola]MEC5115590.1 DUF2247 family protein [Xanthomonas oryzae pv. oryzicola]